MNIIKNIIWVIGKTLWLIITIPFFLILLVWAFLSVIIGVIIGTHTLTFGDDDNDAN